MKSCFATMKTVKRAIKIKCNLIKKYQYIKDTINDNS